MSSIFFIKEHPFMIQFYGCYIAYLRFYALHSSGRFVDASPSQEKGADLRPTYMLIALNRRNRDQHNETDNQRTPLELPSRFHIIMSPVQPCSPRHTVAHRHHVPVRLGECIRSAYTSLRHVAAFFCPAGERENRCCTETPFAGTYVHIELYD